MASRADRSSKSREPARAPARGGPPALAFHLTRRLSMLAFANVIPLIGGIWLWWQFSYGDAHLRMPVGNKLLWASAVTLIGCLLIAATCWLMMPLARWLRDYPTWQCQHRSWVVWSIPAALGWLSFLAIYLLAAVTVVACLVIISYSLWDLFTALS
jgi:hypothetical protein